MLLVPPPVPYDDSSGGHVNARRRVIFAEAPMPKTKQLTVWLQSAPGQIGQVAQALGDAKVNISAFSCSTRTGPSPLRLQVSDYERAREILQGLGLRLTEEEVLRVTVTDRPGALARIGQALGAAGVNVEYAYGAVTPGARKAELVLGVTDLEGALQALKPLKIT
jgi:hypothetical protein